MSNPYIGQITMFGGNFAPRGWALCDGQLLAISSHSALFSILGTTYGGDGVSTFALPDLRGRASIHPGTGPGLSHYSLGQKGGSETNTLHASNLPSFQSNLNVRADTGNTSKPTGNAIATDGANMFSTEPFDGTLRSGSVTFNGQNQAVNNIEPFLCVNYIIALEGVYPPRN